MLYEKTWQGYLQYLANTKFSVKYDGLFVKTNNNTRSFATSSEPAQIILGYQYKDGEKVEDNAVVVSVDHINFSVDCQVNVFYNDDEARISVDVPSCCVKCRNSTGNGAPFGVWIPTFTVDYGFFYRDHLQGKKIEVVKSTVVNFLVQHILKEILNETKLRRISTFQQGDVCNGYIHGDLAEPVAPPN